MTSAPLPGLAADSLIGMVQTNAAAARPARAGEQGTSGAGRFAAILEDLEDTLKDFFKEPDASDQLVAAAPMPVPQAMNPVVLPVFQMGSFPVEDVPQASSMGYPVAVAPAMPAANGTPVAPAVVEEPTKQLTYPALTVEQAPVSVNVPAARPLADARGSVPDSEPRPSGSGVREIAEAPPAREAELAFTVKLVDRKLPAQTPDEPAAAKPSGEIVAPAAAPPRAAAEQVREQGAPSIKAEPNVKSQSAAQPQAAEKPVEALNEPGTSFHDAEPKHESQSSSRDERSPAPSQPVSRSTDRPVVEQGHTPAAPAAVPHSVPYADRAEPPQVRTPPSGNGEPAPAPRYVPTEPPLPPASERPLQQVTFRHGDVNVRVNERQGAIHVAVSTPDGNLSQDLQKHLPEFLGKLQDRGFEAEGWTPAHASSKPEGAQTGQSDGSDQSFDRQQDTASREHQNERRRAYREAAARMQSKRSDSYFTGDEEVR